MFPDLFWRCCCQGEFCWIQRWFQKISLAATLHDGGKLFNGADTPENQLSKSMFIHVHVHKIAASSCFCHPPSHFPYEIRVVRILYILYNILPNFLHGCCLENWSFHKSCWFVQVLVIWYFLIYDMYIPRSVYNVASKSPMWRWHPAIIIYIYISGNSSQHFWSDLVHSFLREIPSWLVPSSPILGARESFQKLFGVIFAT